MTAPARPKFAEMEEEPVYTPLPRDYASETGVSERVEERRPQPVGALFAEAAVTPNGTWMCRLLCAGYNFEFQAFRNW